MWGLVVLEVTTYYVECSEFFLLVIQASPEAETHSDLFFNRGVASTFIVQDKPPTPQTTPSVAKSSALNNNSNLVDQTSKATPPTSPRTTPTPHPIQTKPPSSGSYDGSSRGTPPTSPRSTPTRGRSRSPRHHSPASANVRDFVFCFLMFCQLLLLLPICLLSFVCCFVNRQLWLMKGILFFVS